MFTTRSRSPRESSRRHLAVRTAIVGAVALTSTCLVLALAPAANAATPALSLSTPLTGGVSNLVGGVVNTVGTVLGGVTGTMTSTVGSSTTNLGIGIITTGNGNLAITVPVLQTTVAVNTTNTGVGVTTAVGSTSTTVGTGGDTTNPTGQQNLVVNPVVATSTATGTPGAVGIHLWANTAFPYKDGYLDSIPVSITAVDTNGSTLPIHGDVVVSNGSASKTTSFADATGSVTVAADATDLPTGSGLLTVHLYGPNSVTPVTSTDAVTLAATDLTKLALAKSAGTIYPFKDGYKDSVLLTVNGATSTGKLIATSGTAKLYKGSRLVQTWKITKSTQAITWNGRVKGAIEAGKYVLKVAIKGPQGVTRNLTENVMVSGKKLITKTVLASSKVGNTSTTHTVRASGGGKCVKKVALVCIGATKAVSAKASTIALPPVAIPAAVKAGQKYGVLQVRAIDTVTSVKGAATWTYSVGTAAKNPIKVGKHASKWFTFTGTKHSTLPISIQLGKNSRVDVQTTTFQYRYKKLV